MERRKASASSRGSTLLFLLMVGAAGCITWYGVNAREPVHAGAAATQPVTLPSGPAVESPAPTGAPAAPRAGLPTRIVVDRLGLDAPIQGVGVVTRNGARVWETAWTAVGHHIDSARPGQPGNMILTGHVSVANRSFVPYFANLDTVQPGDIVDVFSGETVYHYRVDGVREVSADEVRVLRADHRSRLTLITCTRDLKRRVVVTGNLVAG